MFRDEIAERSNKNTMSERKVKVKKHISKPSTTSVGHHVAIMSKSLGFIEKIMKKEKNIESRWSQTKRQPWGKVKIGDFIYFKDSGERAYSGAEI
mmetsp:Transcript_61120/g.70007  ORF Transcript_61120/g.70007 Transcript_61120/m.70007 type:complete len:95 (+) Transcript_61120:505-789(+)